MKYIDGKFFDAEGNIVPVKFGDKEQIELLKRNTENTKRLTKGTYAAHIDEEYFEDSIEWKFKIDVDCICGRSFSKIIQFSRAGELLIKQHTCECGREYSLSENGESEFEILVKLK